MNPVFPEALNLNYSLSPFSLADKAVTSEEEIHLPRIQWISQFRLKERPPYSFQNSWKMGKPLKETIGFLIIFLVKGEII